MPKPKNQFSRPSIDLGGAKKAWATVQANQLEVEDLIKGQGLIVGVHTSGKTRQFHMASGLVIIKNETDEVEAYVKVSNV